MNQPTTADPNAYPHDWLERYCAHENIGPCEQCDHPDYARFCEEEAWEANTEETNR